MKMIIKTIRIDSTTITPTTAPVALLPLLLACDCLTSVTMQSMPINKLQHTNPLVLVSHVIHNEMAEHEIRTENARTYVSTK